MNAELEKLYEELEQAADNLRAWCESDWSYDQARPGASHAIEGYDAALAALDAYRAAPAVAHVCETCRWWDRLILAREWGGMPESGYEGQKCSHVHTGGCVS